MECEAAIGALGHLEAVEDSEADLVASEVEVAEAEAPAVAGNS